MSHVFAITALLVAGVGAIIILMRLFRVLAFPWAGVGEDLATFEYAGACARFLGLPLAAVALAVLLFSKDASLTLGQQVTEKPAQIEISLEDITEEQRTDHVRQLTSSLSDLTLAVKQLRHSLPGAPPSGGDSRGPLGANSETPQSITKQAQESPQPILPPDKLERIVADLDGIKEATAKFEPSASLISLWEHIGLIEVYLWQPRSASDTCEALPQIVSVTSRTSEEKKLTDLARDRHLTPKGLYRITRFRLFFDPGKQTLSKMGMAALRAVAQKASNAGLAMVIRTEADEASDGTDAKTLARDRANLVVDYLVRYPVPIVAIGVGSASGEMSEPYHRVVHIDVLATCDRAENAQAGSAAGSGGP